MYRTTKIMIAAAAAGILLAQGPGGTPPDPATMVQRRVANLTSQLQLTEAQQTSATDIFTKAMTAVQALQSSIQSNRNELTAAMKSNNTAAIDTLSAAAGTLSGQVMAINTKAEAAFYAILTADQQAKYGSLRGPGGFGGPGFGGPGFGPARFGPPPR
jgi:Spy/CpxP family protein refolding chaperone